MTKRSGQPRPSVSCSSIPQRAAACWDLLDAATGLSEVSLDAESDPGGRVTCRLVAAPLDVLQDAVVVGGVFAEVFLDGGEFGCEQSFAGEDERLDDAGDASVAVPERMDGDDV